ncbi:MAG: purine-cytosine permease family protein [Rhodoluna sp.]
MDFNQFKPPARRSLTDAQLQDALGNASADEAGITGAMELLEQQAQLRDIEKMEFSSWVLEMERNGSPEALFALENAKRAQSGLPPLEQPTQPAVEPVKPMTDPVEHLNNLYAAAQQQEIQQPEVAEPEPVVYEPEEFIPVIEITETLVTNNDVVADDDLDAFERLLIADTIAGAEEELTAIEEEFGITPVDYSLQVFENDPGVEFEPTTAIEHVDLSSVPNSTRRSKPVSQFWAWLALGGSVLPVGLAWIVSQSEISFSQAALAIFAGTFASALVVAIGALAGKRSGLPTLMLSRAAFGIYGNIAPGFVLTVVRFFWSMAIVATTLVLMSDWLGTSYFLTFDNYTTNHWIIIGSFAFIVIAGVTLAIFGGRVLYRAQQVAGIVGILSVAAIAIAVGKDLSVDSLLAEPSTSNTQMIAAAVLTFSIFGLAWTSASSDFARKLTTSARGASVIGWTVLALTVIPTIVAVFALVVFGSVSSDTARLATIIPDIANWAAPWLGYVLLGSAAVTFIVILAMSLYASNLSLHSLGVKLKPAIAQPILGLIFVGGAIYEFIRVGASGIWYNLSGYALVIGIPVAAWSGIFVADILIRRIAYHEISLSRSYGFYKTFNVANLIGWLVASAAGLGLIKSELPEFTWTGYLIQYVGREEFWVNTSVALVASFALALLFPVALGIPRIKRQEQEVLAIEARRDDLKDVLGLVD